MTFWQSLSGSVQIEITCPYPETMLTAINVDKIRLWDIIPLNQLSFLCSIQRRDYSSVSALVVQHGGSVKCRKKLGSYWSFFSLRSRPILLASVLVLFVLTVFLPTRVLFVDVDGNVEIPKSLILEAAENCGIHFGTSRERIRSEAFKNALLERIPQLQWAGVNTKGCTAMISVRERSVEDSMPSGGANSIVAIRDGIIYSITVTKGTPNCQIGESVKEGQLLVSGYTDCGLVIKATGAEAEVYGETKRDVLVIAPNLLDKEDDQQPDEPKYSIIIGKKFINLSQDSGISGSTCVKMYKIKYMMLPGGFRLPVGILAEYQQSMNETGADVPDDPKWLVCYTEDYVKTLMVSGEILESEYVCDNLDDCTVLYGELSCREIIGRIQIEEKLSENGEEH